MSDPSFLDRPLLKVSRPVAACSRCRKAKIKCDGKLPACSACERAGRTGTCSSSDEFPRGKERSYVGSLEAYCERLERKATELRRRKASLTGGNGGVVHESSITSASSGGPVTQAHRQEVSNIDDLVGDFGYLSVVFIQKRMFLLLTSCPVLSAQLRETFRGLHPIPPLPICFSPSHLASSFRDYLPGRYHLDPRSLPLFNITSILFLFNCRFSTRQASGRPLILFTGMAPTLPNHLTIGSCEWCWPLHMGQCPMHQWIAIIGKLYLLFKMHFRTPRMFFSREAWSVSKRSCFLLNILSLIQLILGPGIL